MDISRNNIYYSIISQYDIASYLRVQNEQFSKERGFILRDTEKEV